MTKGVIMTVGTSLLTNNGWRRGEPIPDSPTLAAWAANAAKPSAEMSTWQGMNPEEVGRICLIATATEPAQAAAKALLETFPLPPSHKNIRTAERLGTEQEALAYERGLRNFADEVISEIREAEQSGLHPVLALTGGTKGQTALGFLIGSLRGVPCLYRHEDFRDGDNAQIPFLPVAIDREFFAKTSDFWDALVEADEADGLSYADIQTLTAAYDPITATRLRAFTGPIDQDIFSLTAVGKILAETWCDRLVASVAGRTAILSRVARMQWNDVALDARKRREMQRRLSTALDYIEADQPKFDSKHNSDLSFYPTGGRKANSQVSLYRTEKGEWRFCEFFFSHDEYMAAVNKKLCMKDRYGDFEAIRL